MIDITNIYFNYIKKKRTIQVDGGKNMIIGICGKSGSGKSTLAKALVLYNENAINIDIDEIGHDVLMKKEVKEELNNCFGDTIIIDNIVDRKRLGEIVFNSRNEMEKLSNVTWKYMEQEIDKLISENKDKIIILDWALLPLTKYFDICDIKILLDIPYETRKKRAMNRDIISSNSFDLREKNSIDFDTLKFDYVIKNNNKRTIKRLVKLI